MEQEHASVDAERIQQERLVAEEEQARGEAELETALEDELAKVEAERRELERLDPEEAEARVDAERLVNERSVFEEEEVSF